MLLFLAFRGYDGQLFAPWVLGLPVGEEVTDSYLAELATSKGMKLATLDEGISHQAVALIGNLTSGRVANSR